MLNVLEYAHAPLSIYTLSIKEFYVLIKQLISLSRLWCKLAHPLAWIYPRGRRVGLKSNAALPLVEQRYLHFRRRPRNVHHLTT
jgi:hypothetical protein